MHASPSKGATARDVYQYRLHSANDIIFIQLLKSASPIGQKCTSTNQHRLMENEVAAKHGLSPSFPLFPSKHWHHACALSIFPHLKIGPAG